MKKTAVIIGDSFPNTLGLIWSLGEAKVPIIFILVAVDDWMRVLKSKYLRHQEVYKVASIEEVMPLLENISVRQGEKTIICTNDRAAEYIDAHEQELCQLFRTPSRGKCIGNYFDKHEQCKLAIECGLDVPMSFVFSRGMDADAIPISFPILTKPLQSTHGDKKDIHICRDKSDFENALAEESNCVDLIIQEFIEKEFELDVVGVRTEEGVTWGCAIRKYRHYPPVTGGGAYAQSFDVDGFNLNTKGVEIFLEKVGYYGLFSVEFLHKGDKNYFMEVNLRNEGLGYVATASGRNLPALYVDSKRNDCLNTFKSVYMMNVSADINYVKNSQLTFLTWLKQFLGTTVFIDFNIHDLKPLVWRYVDKFGRLFNRIFKSIECFKIEITIDKRPVLSISCSTTLHIDNPIIIEADPFLFVKGDTLYLFYEDKRLWAPGIITMRCTKDGEHWTKPVTVLQEHYHLSFPFVFEEEGKIYMLPETSANHSIRLYRADNNRLDSFSFDSCLLKREDDLNQIELDYSDSLIYKKDGMFYLFTTYNDGKENILELYVSESLRGSYELHPASPVCRNMKYGRMAGPLMEKDNKLYRVAQDCVKRYGDNVHLVEIDELSPTTYREHVVKENLLPIDQSFYRNGGHQYCAVDFKGHTYLATDAKEYKSFFLARLSRKIKCLFKK